MTHGWRVLVGWGCLLLAIASLDGIFGAISTELALLAGAGGALVLIGVLTFAGEKRPVPPRPDGGEPRTLPDLSIGATLVGIGLALFFVGWELGPWMMAGGGGLALVGVANLIRELYAQWRAR